MFPSNRGLTLNLGRVRLMSFKAKGPVFRRQTFTPLRPSADSLRARPGQHRRPAESSGDGADREVARAIAARRLRESNIGFSQKLVAFFASNQLVRAILLFRRLVEREKVIRPTVPLYNTILTGCRDAGQAKLAWTLFNNMKKKGLLPDSTTYLVLLDTFASACDLMRQGRLREYRHVLRQVEAADKQPDAEEPDPREDKRNARELSLERVPLVECEGDWRAHPRFRSLLDLAWQAWQGMQRQGLPLSAQVYNVMLKLVGRIGTLEDLLLFCPPMTLAQWQRQQDRAQQWRAEYAKLVEEERTRMTEEREAEADPSQPYKRSMMLDHAVLKRLEETRASLMLFPLSPASHCLGDMDTVSFQCAIQAASYVGAPLWLAQHYFLRAFIARRVDLRLMHAVLEAMRRAIYDPPADAPPLGPRTKRLLAWQALQMLRVAERPAQFLHDPESLFEPSHDATTKVSIFPPRHPLPDRILSMLMTVPSSPEDSDVKQPSRKKVIRDDVSAHFEPLAKHLQLSHALHRWRFPPNDMTFALVMGILRGLDAFSLAVAFFERHYAPLFPTSSGSKVPLCMNPYANQLYVTCLAWSGGAGARLHDAEAALTALQKTFPHERLAIDRAAASIDKAKSLLKVKVTSLRSFADEEDQDDDQTASVFDL